MQKYEQKKNKNCLIFILAIYIFVLQDPLQRAIPIFRYFDEMISLIVFPVVLIKSLKSTKIKKDNLKIIISLLIIMCIGLYSNLIYKYQDLKMALSDVVVVFKFFMAYFLSNMILKEEFIKNNKSKISAHVKFIIYFLFVCTILNYVFKIWPSDVRFGLMSNMLFYGHQTNLAAVSIFLLALLEITSENNKSKIISIIFLCLILVSTTRLKAIGAIIIIIIMMIYTQKTKRKITVSKVGILGIFAILIAYDQISFYFLDMEQGARKQLLVKSFEIMKDFFPIGTGFATYGSFYSSVLYSPVYYDYGLNKIYGLASDRPVFLTDSFWPMIFGQFGVIGTICYIYCIFLIFKNIQGNFSKNNINLYLGKLICFVYLIISSTSEAAFASLIAIPLAFIMGIKASHSQINKEKE